MLVATTAQLALGQESWVERGMLWRVLQHASAVRQEVGHHKRDGAGLAVPHAADARRLEVVVDGLPLFGGVQLAVDTTLVCALHANGSARRGAAHTDGVVLTAARRRKDSTYPELVGRRGRARLVVLAVEVGGRWLPETQSFLSQLGSAKARAESPLMRRRVEQAWRTVGRPVVTAARAVAMSLLEWQGTRGADGTCPPSHEVNALACSLVWLSESVPFGRCIFVFTTGCTLCLRSLFSSVSPKKKKKKKKKSRHKLWNTVIELVS